MNLVQCDNGAKLAHRRYNSDGYYSNSRLVCYSAFAIVDESNQIGKVETPIAYVCCLIVASFSFSLDRNFFIMLLCCNCCLLNFSPSSLNSMITWSFSAATDANSWDDNLAEVSCFNWSICFLRVSRSRIACWNFLSRADSRWVYSSVIWQSSWFSSARFSMLSSWLWN